MLNLSRHSVSVVHFLWNTRLKTGEITIFFGIFSTILQALDPNNSSVFSTEDIQSLRQTCEAGFLKGVERYEVMLIPTSEHAMILSLAVLAPFTSTFQVY